MADKEKPNVKRAEAAAKTEKENAEKTKAELGELKDSDLEKIAGGATKKVPYKKV